LVVAVARVVATAGIKLLAQPYFTDFVDKF
jgi:hypothetical protein